MRAGSRPPGAVRLAGGTRAFSTVGPHGPPGAAGRAECSGAVSEDGLSVVPTDPHRQPGRAAAGPALAAAMADVEADAAGSWMDATRHTALTVVDCGRILQPTVYPRRGASIGAERWADLLEAHDRHGSLARTPGSSAAKAPPHSTCRTTGGLAASPASRSRPEPRHHPVHRAGTGRPGRCPGNPDRQKIRRGPDCRGRRRSARRCSGGRARIRHPRCRSAAAGRRRREFGLNDGRCGPIRRGRGHRTRRSTRSRPGCCRHGRTPADNRCRRSW